MYIQMTDHIIEAKELDTVLVYPDVVDPEKQSMSVKEAYNHEGITEEDILYLLEDHTVEVQDGNICFYDNVTGVSINWPFEQRKVEQRKYKDGTGPIRRTHSLAARNATVTDDNGNELFKTDYYKSKAEHEVEKLDD